MVKIKKTDNNKSLQKSKELSYIANGNGRIYNLLWKKFHRKFLTNLTQLLPLDPETPFIQEK